MKEFIGYVPENHSKRKDILKGLKHLESILLEIENNDECTLEILIANLDYVSSHINLRLENEDLKEICRKAYEFLL